MAKLLNMKNWMSMLVILGLVGSLAACSNESNNAEPSPKTGVINNQNDEQANKDPVTIRILHNKNSNFPEENPVVEEIRKRTGVNVQFISVDAGELELKFNTMVASNDLPDIYLNLNKAKIKELVENDVIIPMDDLLQEHGKEILKNKGDFLKGSGYIDGKTFAIAQNVAYGNSLAIRKDWLDKLQLPVPTTLDEYYNVLRAFVNDDPDGNQKKDTVGVGVSITSGHTWEHLFTAHGVSYMRGKMIDGKVIPWPLQPGYLDAVKYMNKLYKEGLMELEFGTIPALQLFEKLWNGKMGAIGFAPPGPTQNWMTRYVEDPKPEFVYTIVRGPEGYGGSKREVREDAGPWVHITKASKHPEEAMKVLNFLVSEEGDRLTWAGIDGKHHTMKDGKFEWIEPYNEAAQLRNEGGFAYAGLVTRVDGLEFQLLNETTKQGIQLALDNPIEDAYLFSTPAIEGEQGKILSDLEEEFRTSAIVSNKDLDQAYEAFKAEYLKAGGEQWIQQATEIYEREQAELTK